MHFDFDTSLPGVRDCPYCHWTMQPLRDSPTLDSNEGYLLDYGVGWDPDDHVVTSLFLGDLRRYLWRHFLQPILSKSQGAWRAYRYRRILRRYPHTLICPHCRTLLRRK